MGFVVRCKVASEKAVKFALQTYRNAHNLGNEIQMLAARRFLPQVDFLVECDFWADVLKGRTERIAMIMNGWYAHRPEGWPPPANIIPLLISFHITDAAYEGWNKLGMKPATSYLGESSGYLKHWAPVGARDLYTLEILEKNDIPCYFSGCLTLTLEKNAALVPKRNDFIVCVDVPDDVLVHIRHRTKRPLLVLSHDDTSGTPIERMEKAQRLLDCYQNAHCVITSRLHCAIPCLALETPVLLLNLAPDQYRFSGLNQLVRHCDLQQFLASANEFDFEDPVPNDLDYLKFRNDLVDRTRDFIQNVSTHTVEDSWGKELSLQTRFNSLWMHCCMLKQERDDLRAQVPAPSPTL